MFNLTEQVDENALAHIDTFSRLKNYRQIGVRNKTNDSRPRVERRCQQKLLVSERTPETDVRAQIEVLNRDGVAILTRPTPLPGIDPTRVSVFEERRVLHPKNHRIEAL